MPEEGPFGPTIIAIFRLSRFAKIMPSSCLQALWMDQQRFPVCQLVQIPYQKTEMPKRQNAF